MKAIVLLVATACLIDGLAAYSIKFPFEKDTPGLEESETSFEIDDHLNIIFPNDKPAQDLIVPFPTDDPLEITRTTVIPTSTTTRKPRPTPTFPTRPPTTPSRPPRPPTTPSRPPRPPTTPSRPPRPPTTPSRPPRPTTTPRPQPGRRNPQIYKNAVRSLGPFAGRLANVVLNRQGVQKTVQENEIVYNLNNRRTRFSTEEETEN